MKNHYENWQHKHNLTATNAFKDAKIDNGACCNSLLFPEE